MWTPKKFISKKDCFNILHFSKPWNRPFCGNKHANSSYKVCGKIPVIKQLLSLVKAQVHHLVYWVMQGPPLKQPPPSAYSSKGRKATHKTISLVTLKSTKGKLTTQIVTEVIVCLADLDHCSVPVVTQLVKEQVGYDIILLNNKLYPILEVPSTHGEFWWSTCRKILTVSAKLLLNYGQEAKC